ncbi:MAG: SDR family NAD(P)-dependent oxidoreductase [Aquificae bacterium]|nr:SDR family NAD(P)-dependent oxidoreductase [Aquificota bacterium]
MDKTVLITGVSKGLGKALALEFKKNGFNVCGVSRTKPDFEIDYHITADLTVKRDIQKVYDTFFERFNKIDVLINNAGIGLYESWKDTKEQDLRKLCELNFYSYVFLTQKFLNHLIKTQGTIINVSSVAGKLYVPYMGAYCASKYALNAFSDSLRVELKPFKVHVLNLIVGRINTGFSSRALGSLEPPKTPFNASSQKFAKTVYKAYQKKKREITYPLWYKYFILLAKLFPSIYDRISLSSWEKSKNPRK